MHKERKQQVKQQDDQRVNHSGNKAYHKMTVKSFVFEVKWCLGILPDQVQQESNYKHKAAYP
ncbi:hypothetical protein GCM10027293_22590 [Pontibacter aydingkolensis]